MRDGHTKWPVKLQVCGASIMSNRHYFPKIKNVKNVSRISGQAGISRLLRISPLPRISGLLKISKLSCMEPIGNIETDGYIALSGGTCLFDNLFTSC